MNKIPIETLKSIHSELSEMLKLDFKLNFLKRICDILVIIHNHLNSYQDLMMLVNNLSLSTDSKTKQIILYILELLCEYCFDEALLKSNTKFLTTVFSQYTQDPDYIVRVAAIKATISFLASIEDEKFAKQFSSIIPILLNNTIDSIKQDQQAGKECIESMGDLIENQPKLIKEFVSQFLDVLTQVMEVKSFEEGLRKSALTAIVAICSKNALGVRKSSVFTAKTLPALVRMLTEFDTKDLNEWESDIVEEIASKNDISGVTQDALAKINGSLGVKFLLPLCVKYIQELVSSNIWQHKQAGLMAISVIIDGASEHFKAEMDGLMVLISMMMEETNPIIVWSILTCLAILCTEYTPTFQQKYHNQIMAFILTHLKNPSLKIKYRALSSIVNFCQNMNESDEDADIVKAYATPILQSIQLLMEESINNKQPVLLENVLITLSTVVVILQDSFSQFYSAFMPNLKKTLLECPADTHQQVNIRVHTIECVGYLANAMRKQAEVFIQDFNEILGFLVKLDASGISDDDKHRQAIISVYSQFAACLKNDFSPYLATIMPTILKAVNIDVSLTIRDESESKAEEKGPEFMVDLKLMGGKKFFTLNTDALELKLTASTALASVTKNLKQSILPFAQQIAQVLIPMISLKYSKEIRQNSMKTFSYLINACQVENEMVELMNVFIPPMIQELSSTNKIGKSEESHFILKRIWKILQTLTLPSSLNVNLASQIIAELKLALSNARKMKLEMMEEHKEDLAEADDEMREEIISEYEEFNDLFEVGMDLSGRILKLAPGTESLLMSELSNFFAELLNSANSTDREIILGACFFDELITNGSLELLGKMSGQLTEKYLELTKKRNNCDVQQSTIYGLGMLCQRMQTTELSNFLNEIVSVSISLLQLPDSMKEERLSCTDNVIGALLRIALFHSVPEESVLLQNCLSYFPLKTDEEEAKNIHKLFFEAIIGGHSKLSQIPQEMISSAVLRIKQFSNTAEGHDVLNDEGRLLLQKIGI